MIGFSQKEAEVMVNFGNKSQNFQYNIAQHRWGSEDRFVDLADRWPALTARPAPATRVELADRPLLANLAELA